MKKISFILVIAMLSLLACDTSKESQLIGTWKVESVELINWSSYQADMKTILEDFINKSIDEQYSAYEIELYANEIAQKKVETFEEFNKIFEESKQMMLDDIEKITAEYNADKTTESRIGLEVIGRGTWSLNETGTIITDTDQDGTQHQTIINNLTSEILDFNESIKLRESLSPEEVREFDNLGLGRMIDYDLKVKVKARKQ